MRVNVLRLAQVMEERGRAGGGGARVVAGSKPPAKASIWEKWDEAGTTDGLDTRVAAPS